MTERDPLISKSQAIEALESAWESARSKGRLWSMNELHRAKEILAALPAIPPPRDADENYALMYRIQTLEIENEKLRAALPAIPLDDKLERIMAFAANVRDAEQVSREFLVDGIAAIIADDVHLEHLDFSPPTDADIARAKEVAEMLGLGALPVLETKTEES